ncbi:MAG: response regulator, partial [Alphaproteobacteria bacterium]|nr:response regulator [Alphaproteobacteria bacterium]
MVLDYLQNVRILVAEDNLFSRRIIEEILKLLGAAHIEFVKNGEEAWESIKKEMPDLVLLDWEMGPGDGLWFLSRVRHDPASPNPYLPIIMVTGYADRWHIFQARDAGVNEYVTKPMSAKTMMGRIQAVIERPRRFVRIGKFFGPDRRRQDKIFIGPDKRGMEDALAAKKAAPPPEQIMHQDEINALFNPDDHPPPGGGPSNENGKEPAAAAADKKPP